MCVDRYVRACAGRVVCNLFECSIQCPPQRAAVSTSALCWALSRMALFLFVASALAAADATAHFGMTLPLYQQPSADWKRVAKSAVDNPSVNIGVILAPYNGIPDVPNAGDDIEKYVAHNQTWLDYMDMLRNGGVSIMHYLHMRNLTCGVENECDTCEGTAGKFCCLTPDGICVDVMRCCNSIENVTSIVNASTTYFPQDGIFTDNGPYAKPCQAHPDRTHASTETAAPPTPPSCAMCALAPRVCRRRLVGSPDDGGPAQLRGGRVFDHPAAGGHGRIRQPSSRVQRSWQRDDCSRDLDRYVGAREHQRDDHDGGYLHYRDDPHAARLCA